MNPLLRIALSSIAGGLLGLALGYVWVKVVHHIRRWREEKRYPQQYVATPTSLMSVTLQDYRKQLLNSLYSTTPSSVPLLGLSEPATELEETWSPEKIETWRVIPVTVDRGDPDGLWLGFPHPDGPDEPVVTPVHHPVGVELTAKCNQGLVALADMDRCSEAPGENCQSGYGSGCGYYAYKTREQALKRAAHSPPVLFVPSSPEAVAKVLLSGKVIEHEGGYRAEKLEVVEVEAPPMVRESNPTHDLMMQQWIVMTRTATNFALGTSVKKNDLYKDIANGTF